VNFAIEGKQSNIKKILEKNIKESKKIEGEENSYLFKFQEFISQEKLSFLLYIEQIDDTEKTQQSLQLSLLMKEKQVQTEAFKKEGSKIKMDLETQLKKLFS
jgi:hypothetical protein